MRLRAGVGLVALVLLFPVAGCGQDPIDAYCSDLSAHRKEMASMLDANTATALLGHRAMLGDLAKKTPPDLQDSWQTFLGALDGLHQALDHAHVKPSQFVAGKPPPGLAPADERAIIDAADQLSSDEVVAAATGIEQQARDVCKINLGL
jgi:hypothetical protein